MFQVIRISPTQAGTAVTSVRPRRRRRRSLPDPVGRRGQAGVSTGGRPRGREERGAAGPAAGRRGRRDHHRHQRRGRDGGPESSVVRDLAPEIRRQFGGKAKC